MLGQMRCPHSSLLFSREAVLPLTFFPLGLIYAGLPVSTYYLWLHSCLNRRPSSRRSPRNCREQPPRKVSTLNNCQAFSFSSPFFFFPYIFYFYLSICLWLLLIQVLQALSSPPSCFVLSILFFALNLFYFSLKKMRCKISTIF